MGGEVQLSTAVNAFNIDTNVRSTISNVPNCLLLGNVLANAHSYPHYCLDIIL